MISPLKRTWSRRGQTPRIRTSIQHNQRLNLLGALLITPAGRRVRLAVRSYSQHLSGNEVIRFLRQLLRRVSGPIVLLWDKHPIHQRRTVQEFLASQSRLWVYTFPTAAPEFNPVEFVWAQVSEYTAGTAPRNQLELTANVSAAISRTRNSHQRCKACVMGARLSWL